ncbi:MAG: AAA family ATPase [Bacteroidia bacterium]
MHVVKIELENFRGVGKLEMEFDPHVTVLIGKNGAGKTTIIEGTHALLYQAVLKIIRNPAPYIFQAIEIKNGLDFAKLAIEIQANDTNTRNRWSIELKRGLDGRPFVSNNSVWLENLGNSGSLEYQIARAQFPLIAYYSVSRSSFGVSLSPQTEDSVNRAMMYESQGQANFRLFFEWYRVQEDLENETRLSSPDKIDYRDPQLEAVRRAFLQIMPSFTDLRVRRNPLRLELKKGNEVLLIDQLSLGEKSLLAMIGDLARYLAIRNPNWPNPLEGNGIILIDERSTCTCTHIGSATSSGTFVRFPKLSVHCFPPIRHRLSGRWTLNAFAS